KREWLRTLEDRSSAELIIIPNPNIQTPEYSIRRVRDDEADLPENRQTSYLMPTAPEPTEPGSTRDKRPPAEAPAVAALLPSTPAPMMAQPAAVATAAQPAESAAEHRANGGIRAWFKKLFVGDSEAAESAHTAAPAPAVAEPSTTSAHRSTRGGHGRDHDRRPRDRDVSPHPPEPSMSAGAPPSGGEPRFSVEPSAEQRQSTGDRTDRGERGERRGRRRGRRGRHGGGGAGREGGAREPGSLAGPSATAQEGGVAEFSTGTPANGAHEHHHEPAPASESFAPAERREPREAPARHEEPTAPVAHFEPSPPTESNTPREAKPYVVWSSAPPDHASTGGSRGSEE